MIIDAPLWLIGVLLMIVGVAAAWDVRTLTIPNAFPLSIVALFAIALSLLGYDFGVLSQHLASAAIGFVLGAVLFAFRLMGGGDVKLFAAISLWIPVTRFGEFAATVALAGAILAGAVITVLWLRRLRGPAEEQGERSLRKARLP